MKNAKYARIFVDIPLISGDFVSLSKEDSHYIAKVLRKKSLDTVILFNKNDGDYLGQITKANPNQTIIKIVEQIKQRDKEGKIWLIFSPLKAHRMPFLIEKATELGIRGFIPVIFENSVVDKINIDKISSWIKEASEQCERNNLPIINKIEKFSQLIKIWPQDKKILLCNENEKNRPLTEAYRFLDKSNSFAIIIGPEGGFSDKEISLMNEKEFIMSYHLGKNILRAETAAITALAILQSQIGDFYKGPRN